MGALFSTRPNSAGVDFFGDPFVFKFCNLEFWTGQKVSMMNRRLFYFNEGPAYGRGRAACCQNNVSFDTLRALRSNSRGWYFVLQSWLLAKGFTAHVYRPGSLDRGS